MEKVVNLNIEEIGKNWYIVKYGNKWYLMDGSEVDDIEGTIKNTTISSYKTKKALIEKYKKEPRYMHLFKKYNKLDFYTFVNKYNYYDFSRGKIEIDGKVKRGYFYKLCKALTDDDKKYLTTFGNIKLFISQCQYAPEIKNNVIFIY